MRSLWRAPCNLVLIPPLWPPGSAPICTSTSNADAQAPAGSTRDLGWAGCTKQAEIQNPRPKLCPRLELLAKTLYFVSEPQLEKRTLQHLSCLTDTPALILPSSWTCGQVPRYPLKPGLSKVVQGSALWSQDSLGLSPHHFLAACDCWQVRLTPCSQLTLGRL